MSLLNKNTLRKQLEFELYMTQNFPKSKWERDGEILNFYESDWIAPVVTLYNHDIDSLTNAGINTINGGKVFLHNDAPGFFINTKLVHIYNGSSCQVEADVVTFDEKVGPVNVKATQVIVSGGSKLIKVSRKAKINCETFYFETDSIWLSRKIQRLKNDNSLNPLKELGIDNFDCKLLCIKSKNLHIRFSNHERYIVAAMDQYADGWFSVDI